MIVTFYLRLYSLLQEKSWRGAGSLSVFVLIVGSAVISLLHWLNWQSWARDFLLCYLVFIIVLTSLAAYEKRCELKRVNNSLFTARMKLHAEIWAGCTVIAFAGQFAQLGATFDDQYSADRLARLTSVSQLIHIASGCPAPASVTSCKALEHGLSLLPQYAKRKPDPELTLIIAGCVGGCLGFCGARLCQFGGRFCRGGRAGRCGGGNSIGKNHSAGTTLRREASAGQPAQPQASIERNSRPPTLGTQVMTIAHSRPP